MLTTIMTWMIMGPLLIITAIGLYETMKELIDMYQYDKEMRNEND